MKYITSIVFGVFSIILFSFLATPLLNDKYISIYKIEPGPDGETELIEFLLFIQWPIFFVVGSIAGYFLHTKFLTN